MVNEDFKKIYRGSKKRGEEQHPMEVNEPEDSPQEQNSAVRDVDLKNKQSGK